MRNPIIIAAIAAVIAFTGTECKVFGAEEKKTLPAVPFEKGGALLSKGRLVIEPGVQYSHFSKDVLSISGFTLFESIHIGLIKVEKIERDIINPFVNIRYGLKDVELELKVPYFFRGERVTVPVGDTSEEITIDDNGLGDIEGAVYLHLLHEKEARPEIIANFKVKFPTGKDPYGLEQEQLVEGTGPRNVEFATGSGHWGISGGLTFVKTSDPAVLFLNLAYYYNISRDVGVEGDIDYGKIDPGDSFEYDLGLAFALNEQLSISFSFDQRFTKKTKQDGDKVPETDANAAAFNIGGHYIISDKVSTGVSLGIGLTNDAPDVSILVRVPINI